MTFDEVKRKKSASTQHEGEDVEYVILSSDDDCYEFIDQLPTQIRDAVKKTFGDNVSLKENAVIYLELPPFSFMITYASAKLDRGIVCVVGRQLDGLIQYVEELTSVEEKDRQELYNLLAQ